MDKGKDTLFKYGKLVCDFTKGETTDDTLTSFFENVQYAFNFSDNFTKKALKQFPTMKMTIDSLSNEQQYLFKKLLEQNRLLYSLNRAFSTINGHIKYDPIKLMSINSLIS